MSRPIPVAYRRYGTQLNGVLETTQGMLWDTVLYTSGATVALQMFNALRATPDLSNMEAAGQLPYPKSFLIRAISLYIKQRPESIATAAAGNPQTGALDNVFQLLQTGVLTLSIGSKPYIQQPLWHIPAGGGAYGQMMVNNVLIAGAICDWGTVGYPTSRNVLTLTIPQLLEPQSNFIVELFWPAALTLTRNVNICVCLEGDLNRQVQ